MKKVFLVVAAIALLSLSGTVQASVTIDTVAVGNAGNAADTTGYGSVGYAYNIGKYEVTAGQYTDFLNNKAKIKYTGFDPSMNDDVYGLYTTHMGDPSGSLGCNIQRTGAGTVANPYVYTVPNLWANRPVNWVNYWDACRFANWLGNGQGDGSTETGAYTIPNGYNGMDGRTIQRNPGSQWVLTSEDEWYKAAYYDPDKGGTGVSGYWLYPTKSNVAPSNLGADGYTDPGNHANFYYQLPSFPYTGTNTLGSPYWRTNVGEFENSGSPYGTFDQGGNVSEWTEGIVDGGTDYVVRGLRGGSLSNQYYDLKASSRGGTSPQNEFIQYGFRVAEVTVVLEPSSIIANVLLLNWVRSSETTMPFRIQYRKSGSADAPTVVNVDLSVKPNGGSGAAEFSLTDLSPGVYDVSVKCTHWLASKLTGIDVTAGDSTGNTLALKNADINSDNDVNFSDYLILQTQYKKPPGTPSADLNGDGAVNFSDYLILQANYKKVGDIL